MPRQPLMYVKPKAKVRFPANALRERPTLAALVGECIGFWSQVEAHLAILLSAIMRAETAITAAVFLSIRNSRAQKEALAAAAEIGLQGRELEMFSAISLAYQALDAQRTDLAHGLFAVSDDLPEAIVWADAKDFTRQHVQEWTDLSQNPFGAGFFSAFDEALKPKLFVYRESDLIGLRNEISELWRTVFLFNIYLRKPDEEQFQSLYNAPPIQQALTRLREDT
jgi:hypothetical protein